MSNNKNIDYAIKYIKLAIEDYDKFLMEIDKLPEKQKRNFSLVKKCSKICR